MTGPRPEWALAYILQDWKRERAVSKAYRAYCNDDPGADALLEIAHNRLRGYVRALDSLSEKTP